MQTQITVLPLPPDLPSFPAAMMKLGTVPLVIYQALEEAALKTAEFRDAECPGEPLEDGLAATLLRFHAKRFLVRDGIDAHLDEDWNLDWLPFLGISFHYAGYHVRILKGSGGIVPGCGTSERKIKFYKQVPTMYLVGTTPHKPTANLLVLWDFNAVYALSGLWLALPASGGARSVDVSAFWCEPIPHPAEGLKGVPAPQPPPTDDLGNLLIPLSQDLEQEQGE